MNILQSDNSTKLNLDDIKNICDDYTCGMSRNNIQKKYHIGGNRIAKILKANNITKNSKYIIIRDSPDFIGGNLESDDKMQNNYSNNLDIVLSNQIENMKKSMESIKFKSFI